MRCMCGVSWVVLGDLEVQLPGVRQRSCQLGERVVQPGHDRLRYGISHQVKPSSARVALTVARRRGSDQRPSTQGMRAPEETQRLVPAGESGQNEGDGRRSTGIAESGGAMSQATGHAGASAPTIDDIGLPVTVPAVVSRVVSLVPSLTETVASCAPALLVGATNWCTHPCRSGGDSRRRDQES